MTLIAILLTIQVGACTFTTNVPEFEKDAELACKAELAMSIDVTGEYPGDVTVTVKYDFDYASKGAQQVANTAVALSARAAAVESNQAMRIRHPGVRGYTVAMRDRKRELCRFVFDAEHAGPDSAMCAAWVRD